MKVVTNMKQYFLTIDTGGTNTKTAIFDEFGTQIAVSSFYTQSIERKPGFREIDLRHLIDYLGNAIKDVIHSSGIDATQIKGISTVGHGKGLYILDGNQSVFMNGILSADGRAADLAAQFEKRVQEIYEISWQHIMPSQAPVILRWIKENEPDNYQRIDYVLSSKDFVRFLLTGKIFQERGDASGNNFLNLKTGEYDQQLFDFFGIPEVFKKMPKLVNATDQCGIVNEHVAQMTGLTPETPVFGGMFDIDACSIATGVLDDSKISLIAGTWNMNIFPCDKKPLIDSGLMSSIFPTGKTLVEASSPTSAGNLSLIIRMLLESEQIDASKQGKTIYDTLEYFLEETDASFSKVIFFPFLYGSNVDPAAEGTFIGIRSSTTKLELLRAVYEGITFAHRYHIEQLLKIRSARPESIRMSGGACNSASWVQMFANILNIPVELVKANELGGLGGAMASAVGIGIYDSLESASKNMTRVTKRYEPEANQVAVFEAKYQQYKLLLDALDGSWASFKSMQGRLD